MTHGQSAMTANTLAQGDPSLRTSAVYVIHHRTETAPHVALALDALGQIAARIVIVTEPGRVAHVRAALADHAAFPAFDIIADSGSGAVLSAYGAGLLYLLAQGPAEGPVILTGYHVFGPILPAGWQDLRDDADLLAPYWHNAALDTRLQGRPDLPDVIPYLDFARLSPALVNSPAFQQIWRAMPRFADYWDEVERGMIPLACYLRDAGHRVAYALPAEAMQTADPRHNEVDKIVELGAPCLPLSCLTLDPLLHDLNAIDLRRALDLLRAGHPALYRSVIAFATDRVPLRVFSTIADQYEILTPHYRSARTGWSFGKVAVFIHAYYPDMMPEFWAQIVKFPMPAHLFLSTASEDNKTQIETFLTAQGWPEADRTVRVVAQNRGRDMSSLFITFRDVVLSGEYDLALRLHSKRTPQVSRQVAKGFKSHLFDNLLHSPETIRQLLDRFEDEPDIGLMMPPVIHVGFGTLGHAWYSNRALVQQLCTRLGVRVPLDQDTPVAPYGTMFWFRPQALRPLFAWPWRWDEYNPEPHHIDGGLAHAQERMIGYVAQASGYRVLQIMTADMAARNYAKLEYKLQLFAARLASHHLLEQVAQLDRGAVTVRARTDRGLRRIYGWIIRRFPATRSLLRPMALRIALLLKPG